MITFLIDFKKTAAFCSLFFAVTFCDCAMYENILQTIGSTPLVQIQKLNPNANVRILAKIEGFNPTGSIKDRIALKMIEKAEAEGKLTYDKIIIEATSEIRGLGLQ